MRKRTIGMLFVLTIFALVTGIFTLAIASKSFSSAYDPHANTHDVIINIGNLPFFLIGVAFCVLGFILYLVGWINALINMARAREWSWLILLLLFQWVCLVAYLFAAPEVFRMTKSPIYSQPYQGFSQSLYVDTRRSGAYTEQELLD